MRRVVALIAPALAPVIEVDDLVAVGETPEPRFEERVVEAWASVQEQQHRLVADRRTVRHEARAFDVEVQPNARLDLDPHAASTTRHRARPVVHS